MSNKRKRLLAACVGIPPPNPLYTFWHPWADALPERIRVCVRDGYPVEILTGEFSIKITLQGKEN